MIRQCAWCLVMMGETPPLADTAITHGICEKCEKEFIKQAQRMVPVEKMRKIA
jgi:hypothetical protein